MQSIDNGEAYRIFNKDGKLVGGTVIQVEGGNADSDLLFVSPNAHNKGIVLLKLSINSILTQIVQKCIMKKAMNKFPMECSGLKKQ